MSQVGTQNELTRNSWVISALAEVPKGARLLDAGAGEQRYKEYCAHLNYVSQDFAQYDGVGDNAGLQTGSWDQTKLDIVSDIVRIPEPDGSFDAILCTEVFEHLPNPILAIEEFSRLLKKEGQLILTAPFCSLTHFAPYHFYSGFNRYFFETHLPDHNFDIVELQTNGNYFEFLAQELRRLPGIRERYTTVPRRRGELLMLKIILCMLERYSNRDTGSQELLHFGFHVRALKTKGL